jgi:hypothetical protein
MRFSQPWLWRVPSTEMWRRVVRLEVIERFRGMYCLHLQDRRDACCLLLDGYLFCLLFYAEMEAVSSSETSVDFYRTTWHHNPKHRIIEYKTSLIFMQLVYNFFWIVILLCHIWHEWRTASHKNNDLRSDVYGQGMKSNYICGRMTSQYGNNRII